MNFDERGFSVIVVLTLLAGVFALGGGVYFLSKKSASVEISPANNIQSQTVSQKTKDQTVNLVDTVNNTQSDLNSKQTTLSQLVLPEDVNAWKIYENSAKGFRIRYPEIMNLFTKETARGVHNPSGLFIPMCQRDESDSDFDVCLRLSWENVFPKTNPDGIETRSNFNGGAIEFSASPKNECFSFESSGYEVINGVRFMKGEFGGGAGQHLAKGLSYQHINNNQCYQIMFATEEVACDRVVYNFNHCITASETDSIQRLLQKVASTFEIINSK